MFHKVILHEIVLAESCHLLAVFTHFYFNVVIHFRIIIFSVRIAILKHVHINVVTLVRDYMLVLIDVLIYVIKLLSRARICLGFVYYTFVAKVMLTTYVFNLIVLLLIIFLVIFLNTKSIIPIFLVRILIAILLFGDNIFIAFPSLLLLFCLHLLLHLYLYIFFSVEDQHIQILVKNLDPFSVLMKPPYVFLYQIPLRQHPILTHIFALVNIVIFTNSLLRKHPIP